MTFISRRGISKAISAVALFCMATQPTFAALQNLSQEPLIAGIQVPPQIMLAISKDQQLYKKAYNDYSDLDANLTGGDAAIETTYKHSIEYYGYFDPDKCYDYVVASGRFEPRAFVNASRYCNGNTWSGNFLNWVSMSRMDAVRKLLYGGLRQIDQKFDEAGVPITVLERAYLPTDAHAWAKYYNGSDIRDLTPFSNVVNVPVARNETTSPNFTIPSASGDYNFEVNGNLDHVSIGDQLHIANSATAFLLATVLDKPTAKRVRIRVNVNAASVLGSGSSFGSWTVTNLSSPGISFCNFTPGEGAGAESRSSTNSYAPRIHVARGNFALWNANERVQCRWAEDRSNLQGGFAGGLRSNGNQVALSEMASSAENPSRADHALGTAGTNGEFIARVKVCDPTLIDTQRNRENCKRYPKGNWKPTGLLQQYGDGNQFHFGLMTGSYARNISGGVLRKNPGTITDEIRVDTDGAFREKNTDGTFRDHPYRPRGGTRNQSAAQSPPGIINTLNYMRIYGYDYAGESYLNGSGDNCTYQLTSLTENSCTSWGNPMSEVFFESIRYFAGQSANYAYTASPSKDNELGLPLATFQDPLNTNNYCAPLNVVMFNAAVSDNEEDLRGASAASINATGTVAGLTNTVGQIEGINGNNFFVGKMVGSSPTPTGDANGFELCTGKTVGAFGDISGICPEGPTLGGTYLSAGLAHHARTTRIRNDAVAAVAPANDTRSLKVNSYGIQLATNTPQLVIEGAGHRVVLQPIYRLNLGAGNVGGGGLVDLRYVRPPEVVADQVRGKVYVNWEDSEQGGDYDQDMWGTLEWTLNTTTRKLTVTTNAVSASTANPQGFGYSVSGTTRDGPHFHSGIYGFNYTDPTGVLGCSNCNLTGSGGQTGPQTVVYDLSNAPPAGTLKDPMWYMAKYGGFTDSNNNNRPDVQNEWDRVTNHNGAATPDGEPDNYFLVTNPIGLVTALSRAFAAIGVNTAGAASITNSTSLETFNRVYQARLDPAPVWGGQFLARDVVNGVIQAGSAWDAGLLLNAQAASDQRKIITFDNAVSRDGVAFRDGPATAIPTLFNNLNASPETGVADGLAAARLAYLRGIRTNESPLGPFRNRPETVLGDIVNSDPAYVGPPSSRRRDASFATFFTSFQNRPPIIYVGANDGMLHGFDAITGAERLAYVPSKVFPHLNKLTSPNYSHRFYVDGSPEVVDAMVDGAWKTVLVGSLGAGGQGLYALDVTDPSTFTEANAAAIALWEFNDSDDPDLGYVYGKPTIRKMANGEWAVIVTGGYNNSEGDASQGAGTATLFVIFLKGPQGGGRTWTEGVDYIKINTTVGDATTPNTLAQPFAADIDGDGMVNFVYAGDLRGNMWKFDLSSAAPADWKAASSRVVLYTAKDSSGNVQPITAPAEGTLHPTGTGYVILFGTGKFIEAADGLAPSFAQQSFYGIWDRNNSPDAISSQTVVASRSDLKDQVITEVSVSGTRYRTVPSEGPDWTTQSGWYMDFPNSAATGERQVFRPIVLASRLIFTTLIPLGDPCQGGGTSFIMIVDPATGAQVTSAVFDVNNDGVLNQSDQTTVGGISVNLSGVESSVGITPTPVVVRGSIQSGAATASDVTHGNRAPGYGSSDDAIVARLIIGGPGGTAIMSIGINEWSGRVTWREIVTQ